MENEELEQIWYQECQEALKNKSHLLNVECTGYCTDCIIHKGFDAIGKQKDMLYMHENYGV
jgi:hypothetical protein